MIPPIDAIEMIKERFRRLPRVSIRIVRADKNTSSSAGNKAKAEGHIVDEYV